MSLLGASGFYITRGELEACYSGDPVPNIDSDAKAEFPQTYGGFAIRADSPSPGPRRRIISILGLNDQAGMIDSHLDFALG
jgi:hypothetical protein